MNKMNVRGMAAMVALTAGAAASYGQVEVVYAIDAHAPGNVKTQVPGLVGATFKNFPRPYISPNGQRWALVATVNGFGGTQDQALITGVGTTGAAVAQEGVTLDSGGSTFQFLTNVSPRISNDGHWISAVSSGDKIVRGDLLGNVTLVAHGGGTEFAPPDVVYGSNAFSSANDTIAGPAFLAVIANSPNGSNKMGIVSGTALASAFVDYPTGQFGGTEYPISELDSNAFWTNNAGTSWLALGKILHPDTGFDKVLIVDGAIRVQEGAPLAGMTAAVTTISEAFMEANGDWYCRGSNSDSTGWLVKNGAVIARTGTAIVAGSSEMWTSFLDVHGNGRGDFAIVGRTNNADANLSDVIVVNNRFVVARESDAVDLNGDGQRETDLFIHVMVNRLMFADDGYVYFASRMKGSATATTDLPNSANSSSFLRVAGCPADMGRAGGLPGADSHLDNNDFIAFISLFFAHDARADRGVAGGLQGSDGQFDNNDFIAFISQFFGGC
ncbi:MAG: GC-type dockerin domain-anchored protein [Phycisphaerales bacterium]